MTAEMTRQRALVVACELAQKFGFLSRAMVWKHLSVDGIASKYRYWHFLKNATELAPYKAGITSDHHLVISAEYRKTLEGSAVSNRSAIYFEHDEYLMDLVLHLKAVGVIAEYWSEQELKMDRLLAIRSLGGDPDKVPDLVFDLTTDKGTIRAALEVERTRKSQARYRLAQLGYDRLQRIDLLLFGVIDNSTELAISREFEQAAVGVERRSVGYFSLDEFATSGLGAELRIRGKKLTLGEFLKRVCG